MEKNLTYKAAQYLAGKLNRYTCKEGVRYDKMALGLEIWIIAVSKAVVIYTLAIIFGVLSQTIIIQFSFSLIKRYAAGLHALNSLVCTAVSCVLFVFVPFGVVAFGLGIGNEVVAVVFVVVVLCLCKYAPADTEARPIVGAARRDMLRVKAVVCAAILLIVSLVLPYESIKLLVTLGAMYQVVCVLPLTYVILRRSERNYEKYELT